MSMNDLFGAAGSKPKLITPYTSGTGTYVPTADMARCLVRGQAGGGGGQTGGNKGGGGGACFEIWIRVPIAGLAYAVGAGGASGANGSNTSFGRYVAMGGKSGTGTSGGDGGVLGNFGGTVDTDSVSVYASSPLPGTSGGGGGYVGGHGNVVGFPVARASSYATSPFDSYLANGQGNSSGGNSFYGVGGTNGNAPAAGNYGAGGGGNAAGLGGYIEIWDFGV